MSSFEKTNHAEICPVCQGVGTITKHYAPTDHTTAKPSYSYTCYGCNGKGWVVIQDIEYTVSGGSNE